MVKEGVYLEEKKSTVGVASTAKTVVFRSLWATREIGEDEVVLQLLDDKGQPTGLVERLAPGEMAERFTYRSLKPEVWSALKAKLLANKPGLGPRQAAGGVKKPAVDKKKAAPRGWWDT